MKILITGSSGFIGQYIVRKLSKENIILLTSKSRNRIRKKNVIYINYDLKKGFIPKLECDILIHAAGITPQKKYQDLEYLKVNYNGLKKILNKIKIKKKKIVCKKFDDLGLNVVPHFIKIDTEGHDHYILKGLTKTIKKHSPIFLIEYNKEYFNNIKKLLKERTSWDGAMLIGVCGAFILFGGLAKILAWIGLGYGIWTLLKTEK